MHATPRERVGRVAERGRSLADVVGEAGGSRPHSTYGGYLGVGVAAGVVGWPLPDASPGLPVECGVGWDAGGPVGCAAGTVDGLPVG